MPGKRIVYKLNKDKKKLPIWAKILIIVLAVAVVAGVVVLLYGSHILGKIERIDPANEHQMTQEEAEQYEKQELEDELSSSDLIKIPDRDVAEVEPDLNNADIKLVTDKNVTNILLIGVDARTNSFVGRSDTMMICSINKNTNTITLLSLMRDLYVEIEGYKNNKLNASYAFGGTRLLNSTIEKNLGIHIDHDVIINFDGFIKAMTEVGSLEISLSKAEVDYLLGLHPKWKLEEGVNTLNSSQLLEYVRARHLDGADWGRTERQRKVIMAAYKRYRSQGVGAMLELINKVTPYIKTDMSNGEIVSTVQTVVSSGMNIGKNAAVPTGNTYRSMYVRGRAVLVPDMAAVSKAVHQYLYGVD
ncbi:MAG: LCP family protein [Firmicutes bacterium]|nr:LCP family protein [Bacillota bacterium]